MLLVCWVADNPPDMPLNIFMMLELLMTRQDELHQLVVGMLGASPTAARVEPIRPNDRSDRFPRVLVP